MRKWMRERMKRRKKSSENTSESTGKIGQAIDRTLPAPLMPSYESSSAAGEDEEAEADDETFGDVNDAPSEPTRPGQLVVETQPESPNTPPAAADAAMRKAPGKREPRGVVVLAIGLPGSGKTTWFKRRGLTPLSSDMLRS